MSEAGAEILIESPITARGERFLQAMGAAAPAGSSITSSYAGNHQVLMIYGPGAPQKQALAKRHLARGGRVVMWDMGYWDRIESMRLAVDVLHPTPAQLAMAGDRPARRTFQLGEACASDGPILLVGQGAKSCRAYGFAEQEWELRKLADLRKRFPGRAIEWRPKGRRAERLADLPMRQGGSIFDALFGCSLVVCRHSNVAVDACLVGIPVECDAGAAAALYAGNANPSREQRADFLRRLSWWEWHCSEAAQAWNWINEVTSCA